MAKLVGIKELSKVLNMEESEIYEELRKRPDFPHLKNVDGYSESLLFPLEEVLQVIKPKPKTKPSSKPKTKKTSRTTKAGSKGEK